MRRSRRSTWALALSVLSLLLAGFSLALTGLTLSELRRVREELRTRMVSAQQLESLWADLAKAETPAEPAAPTKQIRWNGVCPKYGASSIESFREAVLRDPLLKQRFASFRWESARTIVLTEPRTVHVTYRQGDRIGWTRKPLALVAGETLVTDGRTTVRGYCCNEITEGPLGPQELAGGPAEPKEFTEGPVPPTELSAGAAQPTEVVLAAAAPIEMSAGSPAPVEITDPAIAPPPLELSAGPVPPPAPRFAFYTPHGRYGRRDRHDPVPEPGTIVLLGTGLAAAVLFGGRKTRRTNGEPPCESKPSEKGEV